MPADLFTAGRPGAAVVAHRGSGPGIGASGHRENTLEAFHWAIERGATWVECDVQASGDGDLVLHHNVLLDGREVAATPTTDLLGVGLCTLEELHRALPGHVGLNLDIKVGLADATGERSDLFSRVAHWAAGAQAVRRLLITSFCPTVARPTSPVPVGLLRSRTARYYESVAAALRMGADAVAVHAEDVLASPADCPTAAEVAAFAAQRDLAVLAWGVRAADVPALVAGGVTGLCTDDVPEVAAALGALLDCDLLAA